MNKKNRSKTIESFKLVIHDLLINHDLRLYNCEAKKSAAAKTGIRLM